MGATGVLENAAVGSLDGEDKRRGASMVMPGSRAALGPAGAAPSRGGDVQSSGLPSRSCRASRRTSGRGTALLVVEDTGVRTVRAEVGGGRCFEYLPRVDGK